MWQMAAMLNRRAVLASAAALPVAARAQERGFGNFVDSVMAEARRAGIREATLREAFAGIVPNQHVIELDRNQPEFNLTWPEYRARVLPESRIGAARQNYARERGAAVRGRGPFRRRPAGRHGDLGHRVRISAPTRATTASSRRSRRSPGRAAAPLTSARS